MSDIASVHSNKQDIHDALDSAVLAGVIKATQMKTEKNVNSQVKKTVREFYEGEIEIGTVKNIKITTIGNSFQVTASANYKYPSFFGGITGKKTIPISVSSTASAPIKLSRMRLQLLRVEGWWGKSVRFKGVKDGNETDLASIEYTAIGRGYNRQTKISDRGWINVSDFDDIIVTFTIHDNALNYDKWCGQRGCPLRNYSTKSGESYNRFYINGSRQTDSKKIDFLASVKCDQETVYAWEDGGGGSPDLYFKVAGQCGIASQGDVYLSE